MLNKFHIQEEFILSVFLFELIIWYTWGVHIVRKAQAVVTISGDSRKSVNIQSQRTTHLESTTVDRAATSTILATKKTQDSIDILETALDFEDSNPDYVTMSSSTTPPSSEEYRTTRQVLTTTAQDNGMVNTEADINFQPSMEEYSTSINPTTTQILTTESKKRYIIC